MRSATPMAGSDAFDLPLFQPDRGLWIAPIRHHSPACAWAVRDLIRTVRPDQVLIEGPADLTPLIGAVLDPRTRPPVAFVTLHNGRAAYYPMATHSPEYVALQAGREVGAKLRLIDLPSDLSIARAMPGDAPIALTDERAFSAGDYVRALCGRLGCRDGHELWDHLFESRLGQADWQGLLRDVGAYGAGLRSATPAADIAARGDAAREAAMSAQIAAALRQGTVVAIVGSFHAAALIRPEGPAPKVPDPQDGFLVRYGHAAMDALSGYGAGLPQPGFYDALWRAAEEAKGSPDWANLATTLVQDFAAAMKADGHALTVPGKVELLRVARMLAALRGRQAVLRHDLFDGVQSALTKGEVSPRDAWADRLRRHWHGSAMGEVPMGQASPPLVADVRRRAQAHRLDIGDSLERRRSLDIRRKPSHLATARFLHAMEILESGFGQLVSGPDYSLGLGTDLLFEDWTYAWSPTVETRLIALAAAGRGDTLPAACIATLLAAQSGGALAVLDLLGRGIRAGLAEELHPLVRTLGHDIAQSGGFAEMGTVLKRLHALCLSRGPMRAPGTLKLERLLGLGYARLVFLIDDLPHVPEEMAAPAVSALRLVADLLASDDSGLFDRDPFDAAIARLAATRAPAEITGAALALALRAGRVPQSKLVAALNGQFRGVALDPGDRIGMLRGVLATAPELLWQAPDVLAAVDAFLAGLDEAVFLQLLPVLRRSFTGLNPREVDLLAGAIAGRHGERPDTPAARRFTEADLAAGLAAHAAMEAALLADGLLEDEG